MKSSLAALIGVALGSAVAYMPLPAVAQSRVEIEVYEEDAATRERAMSVRGQDLECAEVARMIKKDPSSKKASLEDFLKSCAGKAVILPQTYISTLQEGRETEYTPPYNWVPFLVAASRYQKVVAVFPSVSPKDIQTARENRMDPQDLSEAERVFEETKKAGIEVCAVVYEDPVDDSSFKPDLAQGKRIRSIMSHYPKGTVFFIVGEDFNKVYSSGAASPLGTAAAYRWAQVPVVRAFPIDENSSRVLDEIITDRKRGFAKIGKPDDGPDVKAWCRELDAIVGEVHGGVQGIASGAGNEFVIYTPNHASGGAK